MHHSASDPLSLDLYDQPGHLIRRAQQIAAQLFRDVLGPDVTPVQYAILRMLQEKPGIDQVTLARLVALDNSTRPTSRRAWKPRAGCCARSCPGASGA
jgi:predicted glycosyltransferase